VFKKQQGTSRAFMIEEDMPSRRKLTRKTTNKTGQQSGETGDIGLIYDDNLYLHDGDTATIIKSLDSIIKALYQLAEFDVEMDKMHETFHAIDDYLDKEEKFPRVGCMAGYHDHPGTRGCHRIDKPHRGDIITAMGGSAAYERVHPQATPDSYS